SSYSAVDWLVSCGTRSTAMCFQPGDCHFKDSEVGLLRFTLFGADECRYVFLRRCTIAMRNIDRCLRLVATMSYPRLHALITVIARQTASVMHAYVGDSGIFRWREENERRFCDALLQNRRAARAVPSELLLTYTVWAELFAKNFQTMLVVRGIVPPRGICIFPPPPSRTQYTSVQLPWSAPGVLQLSLMQRSSLSSTLSAVPIVHHQPFPRQKAHSTAVMVRPSNECGQNNLTNRYSQCSNKSPEETGGLGFKNKNSAPYGFMAMLGDENNVIAVVRKAELFWGYELASSLKFIWNPRNIQSKKNFADEVGHTSAIEMELGSSYLLNPLKSIWTPRKAEEVSWTGQELRRLKSEYICGPIFIHSEFCTVSSTDEVRQAAKERQRLDITIDEQANIMQRRQKESTRGYALRLTSSWTPKNTQKSLSASVMASEKHFNKSASPDGVRPRAKANTDNVVKHFPYSATFGRLKKTYGNLWDHPSVSASEAVNQSMNYNEISEEETYNACQTKEPTRNALTPSQGSSIQNVQGQESFLRCWHPETSVILPLYCGPLYLCNSCSRN
uniref:Uncharacterized protein n=2 Tax=Parascaris univalens TaxID=6257 RepID=A0A915A0Q3_PARUN